MTIKEQTANKYFDIWKSANETYGKETAYVKALRKIWWTFEKQWIDTNLEDAHGL